MKRLNFEALETRKLTASMNELVYTIRGNDVVLWGDDVQEVSTGTDWFDWQKFDQPERDQSHIPTVSIEEQSAAGENVRWNEQNAVHAGSTAVVDGQPSGLVVDLIARDPVATDIVLNYVRDDVGSVAVIAGDTDGDRDVDFEDFHTLSQNFGSTDATGTAEGDFDLNGRVDFIDFLMLSENFGV